MPKAFDSGKSFVDQILAKLPENLRDQAKAALTAPEAADALTFVGDGVLARSDYSRQMDEIRAKTQELKEQEETLLSDHKNLTDWYTEKKAVIDKYPSLSAVDAELARARGTTLTPTPEPAPKPPVGGITREELDKSLMERDRSFAGAMARGLTLATRHAVMFQEAIDADELVGLAMKTGKGLDQVYQEKYGDKLKARADAEEAARIQKLVDERLVEERKKNVNQPFPLRNASPSVLDVLQDPNHKASDFGVDAAVAEYERLQSSRG